MAITQGMGFTPGFGNYNSFGPVSGAQNMNSPWIQAGPGGGLVRNPDYQWPIVNGWQQSSNPNVGLVNPGVNQANQQPQTPQTPPQTPQQPAQQQPTPRVPTNISTGYGAGVQGNHVTSGIQAGPIFTPQQTQAALQPFRAEMARAPELNMGVPLSPQQQGDLQGRFQSGMDYRARTAMTDADREMAFGNAQHLLASQRARATSGVGWGNLAARLQEIQANEEISKQNSALSLLAALGMLA